MAHVLLSSGLIHVMRMLPPLRLFGGPVHSAQRTSYLPAFRLDLAILVGERSNLRILRVEDHAGVPRMGQPRKGSSGATP